MRLSTRFVMLLAAIVPLLVLLAGVLVLGLVSADLRAERDRRLEARLSALTPMATTYALTYRLRPSTRPDFLAQRLTGAALGADDPGGVVVDVSGAEALVIGDTPRGRPAPTADGPGGYTEGERRWRYVAADLGPAGNLARVYVFEPEQLLERQIALLRRRLAAVTLIAALAGVGAGLVLGRFAVHPLVVLRRQARELGRSAPGTVRLDTASRVTEIDELAALLNESLARRDEAVSRTGEALEIARAFAATVAHELRTPLTSMGTNLGLLRHPGLEPDDQAEVIADLEGEHLRLQRLITLLRGLARGELVDTKTFTDLDLADIVADAVGDARRRHPRATITLADSGPARVRGWEEGLRVIVDNLLDNAAIHGADEAGRVEITLTVDAPIVVLSVRDHGRGIAPAEREKIFDRFHRGAASPGSGLGLTLVRQQARLHGGEVEAADPEDGPGTRFVVRLPAAGGEPTHGGSGGRPARLGAWLAVSRS
ncbi:sensor histidine kinase [Nonomuraea bangladeshensis]|uniref:sensor histidine kinase n=1 Tax=Nonomuraea bangladeshensis TaxID=404385 RepID=UPI003C2EE82C